MRAGRWGSFASALRSSDGRVRHARPPRVTPSTPARRAEAAAARKRYLASLRGREAELWRKVDDLVSYRQASTYKEAVERLKDLRDLAARKARSMPLPLAFGGFGSSKLGSSSGGSMRQGCSANEPPRSLLRHRPRPGRPPAPGLARQGPFRYRTPALGLCPWGRWRPRPARPCGPSRSPAYCRRAAAVAPVGAPWRARAACSAGLSAT
jgi:hypothetical protein